MAIQIEESIPIYGGLSTFLSTCAFGVLSQYITKSSKSPIHLDTDTKAKTKATTLKEWQQRNITISCIHAALVTVWNISWFLGYSHIYAGDDRTILHFSCTSLYFMVAFSTGYFIYDFIDTAVNTPNRTDVLLHHVIVIWIFVYNLYYSVCLPWTAVALITEANSVFLHARKIIQFNKRPFTDPLYRAVVWLNLLSFFPMRFVPCYVIFAQLYTLYNELSLIYASLMGLSMVAMTLIYIVLLWRLIQSDIIVFYFKGKKEGKSEK